MILSSVDLPMPLGPTTPILAPGKNDSVTSSRMTLSPCALRAAMHLVNEFWHDWSCLSCLECCLEESAFLRAPSRLAGRAAECGGARATVIGTILARTAALSSREASNCQETQNPLPFSLMPIGTAPRETSRLRPAGHDCLLQWPYYPSIRPFLLVRRLALARWFQQALRKCRRVGAAKAESAVAYIVAVCFTGFVLRKGEHHARIERLGRWRSGTGHCLHRVRVHLHVDRPGAGHRGHCFVGHGHEALSFREGAGHWRFGVRHRRHGPERVAGCVRALRASVPCFPRRPWRSLRAVRLRNGPVRAVSFLSRVPARDLRSSVSVRAQSPQAPSHSKETPPCFLSSPFSARK